MGRFMEAKEEIFFTDYVFYSVTYVIAIGETTFLETVRCHSFTTAISGNSGFI